MGNNLESKLKELYDSIESISLKDSPKGKKVYVGEEYNSAVDLIKLDNFIIAYMEDDYIYKNFSDTYIKRKINMLVRSIAEKKRNNNKPNFKDYLKNFRKKIKKDIQDVTYIVPIANLEFRDNNKQINASIKIGNAEFSSHPEPLFEMERKIEKNNSNPYFLNKIKDMIKEIKEQKLIYARINLKLEPIKAKGESEKKVEKYLNFLRLFYGPTKLEIDNDFGASFFGIKKTTPLYNDNSIFCDKLVPSNSNEKFQPIIIEKSDKSYPGLSFNVFYEDKIKKYERKMSEIWSKKEPSKFEQSLLNSIDWFGKAMKYGVEDKDRFVYFAISLEALLNRGKSAPVTHFLKEGVALLLGENKKERKEYVKYIKDIYYIRSKIIHGEKTELPIENDLIKNTHYFYELHNRTQKLIFKLIDKKEEIKKEGDLHDYIDSLKFSLPEDNLAKSKYIKSHP